MAKKTRTELSTLAINTNLPDNTTELITPTTERAQLTDERESVVNYKDDLGGVPNAGKFLTVAVDGESLTMVDEPTGELSGSGDAARIAFWSAAKVLTYDDYLSWNTSTDTLNAFIVNATSKLIAAIIDSPEGNSITLSTQPTGGTLTPRLTISSGGDVGVGLSTTPTIRLEVEDTVDNWVGKIYNKGTGATAGNGLLVRSDANASDAKYVLGVYADGAYKMIVDSTGLATFSNGIQFANPTPAYKVAATTLDAYEEGTWTPTLTNSSDQTISSGVAPYGQYTRVGRLITATAIFDDTTLSAGNSVRVSNLPFTVTSDTTRYAGFNSHTMGTAISSTTIQGGYARPSETNFQLIQRDSNQTVNVTSGTFSIFLTFIYAV